ncbi:ANTAR domain-containing protein [Shewanella glacialimarina]|uniref:ANTAR domain-containing protein n=1 Tax=Shewanella glacialimarina TaxID=2590884 RepID=UPI001CF8C2A1|nr:ANTAR domain-containing protein [Shewanella glacialimarina]UCX04216.1 ANTAR domain-containing protein [Shewanella glacialimarina]
MHSIILCDSTFSQLDDAAKRLADYQAILLLMGKVRVMNSISEVEAMSHSYPVDVMLVLTDKLGLHTEGFIQRNLLTQSTAIIVNANQWQQQQLAALLTCGRLTFVPDVLVASRLVSLVNLARIRFDAANKSIAEFKKLDDEVKGLKLLSQAKLIVMQQGFDEAKAHKIIQQQAMQKGVSVAQMSAQIIAVMTSDQAAKNAGISVMPENSAPHYGAGALNMKVTITNVSNV